MEEMKLKKRQQQILLSGSHKSSSGQLERLPLTEGTEAHLRSQSQNAPIKH
jgi:hypothetical protein